jgi:glycerophosphoryl diester phosphodiesterase
LHDETLDRTTTGKGNLSDYTWEELKDIRLKDVNGNITHYGLPLLEDALEWAKGKTILVLDDKGVPYYMVCDLVRKHNAFSNILMTVRNAKIAKQFYDLDKRFAFEAYVFDMQDVAEYEAEGIPWSHVMAYIGSEDIPENDTLYTALNKRGVKAMISGAPSLDQAFLDGNKNVYRNIFNHGSDIIETNLPVQTASQINTLINPKGNVCKYFGKLEIPLSEIKYIP